MLGCVQTESEVRADYIDFFDKCRAFGGPHPPSPPCIAGARRRFRAFPSKNRKASGEYRPSATRLTSLKSVVT
jgi:hypothetical protein